MAISGQEIINIGVVNQATGSDDLYTAFSKVENNFTRLFSTSSEYGNFVSGNGINAYSNPGTGAVTITNTGVTNITPGTGITLSGSNGNIIISVSGSSTGNVVAGVTNVGITSTTLSVSNSPIISNGLIGVELPNISGNIFTPGQYFNPTVTVDQYGRISNISNNTVAGTVTSIAMQSGGDGISISGGPITDNGTFTITNTGVTKVNAGTGINLSGSTGEITISSIAGGGTVTRVEVSSSSLAISGSPITNLGTIGVELKNDATFSGNVTATKMIVTGSGVDVLKVSGTANIVKDLYVGGNLYVPNLISTNSTTLTVQDPLVYLAANTPYPYSYDIGLYSHFVGGTGNIYQHTGVVRNHADSSWYFFSNATEPSGGTVDLSNANVILDNVKVGNIISLNANLGNAVRGNYFIGSGNNLSNIQAANITGTVANANYAAYAGNITLAAQSNITSVGTLTSLIVTGNISSGNANLGNLITANYITINTNGNVTGNLTAGNTNAGNLLTANYVTINNNANITGNLTSGNANLGNLVTANYIQGVLTTGNQPNITNVGTLGNITVTSNANVGYLNSTGNVVGANINANTLVTAPQLVLATSVPGTVFNGSIAIDGANNRLVIVYNSTIHYINVTA